MSNTSDLQTSPKLEFMSAAAITDYINSQRAVLIRNLAYQRKYLTTLVQERETELKLLSDMTVTMGLLKGSDDIRAEISILRRRLLMLECKESELRKLQVKAEAKPIQHEEQLVRNFSRKIVKDASGGVWI